MRERDAYKVWVRWVLRPARVSQRARLRAVFYATWDAFTPVRNLVFWVRHPVMWVWVRRRVRWQLEGKGYLDA